MTLRDEIAPALWRDCGRHIGREDFDRYMQELPDRLFSKTLRDHVSRGIRNVEAKFEPGERIIGGLELLESNGIRPERYCDLLAAGLEVARLEVSRETACRLLGHLSNGETRAEVRSRWQRMQ